MEEHLTRKEMIAKLKGRHLQVPHLVSLPHAQLEKIYQEFVVPQPQRQQRDRSVPAPMEMEELTQRIRATVVLGQKRPLPVERPSNDDKAKQIKMDLQ